MSATTDSKHVASPLGRVGRYVLRAELASGGMAAVYLADLHGPHGFEKAVAIKRIHPHLAKDRRFVEMFLDEARLAARIHHPNVCAIGDFGEEEGAPYLVMEYLSGEPLSAVMKRIRALDSIPFWLPTRIIHDAALGLDSAHRLRGSDGELVGVVHRDVSPQNVFVLFDGATKVVDFGVARARGRLTTTRTNEIKGKLGYMSPEQFNQEEVDARTDVWALGVVLWEATVGKRLFRGSNDGATLNLVLHKPIPRPSEHVDDYPKDLEDIVMRCLERDRSTRYPSAEALGGDLEEYLYSTGKPAGPSQVRKWMETHFGERIAAQEALLRGESPALLLEVADHEPTRSSLRERRPVERDEQPTIVRADAQRPRGRWRPLAWMSGGALLVLGALAIAGPRGAQGPAESIADTTLPTTSAPAPELADRAPSLPVALERAEARPAVAPEVAVAPPATPPPTEAEPSHAPPARSSKAIRHRAERRPRAASSMATSSMDAAPRPPSAADAPIAAPGRLSLIAIPSATVRLGGRSLGTTPLVNVSLPAGSHRLELRGENGQTKSVNVRITSGETARMRVEL